MAIINYNGDSNKFNYKLIAKWVIADLNSLH